MSSNIFNRSPFLRTSRDFPQDPQALSVELTNSYVDIANMVNDKVIGLFSINRPTITGENWFFANNRKQQTARQIYTFTSAGNIAHGINVAFISGFTRIYGTFTDGTNFYPLPYVNNVSATNQISVVVNATNIVISAGAGSPPSIVSGFCVLEWLLQP